MLALRGHHLVCRLGFRGLGYSDAFVQQMTEIVHLLRTYPEMKLRVIDGPDVLCDACPHLVDGQCHTAGNSHSEIRIQAMDRAVIQILDLQVGHLYSVQIINERMKARFDKAPLIWSVPIVAGEPWGFVRRGLRDCDG